jgi:hypothetical protein
MTNVITFFRAMPLSKKIILLITSIIAIIAVTLLVVFENQIMTGNNYNINYDNTNDHNKANNYFYCKHFF